MRRACGAFSCLAPPEGGAGLQPGSISNKKKTGGQRDPLNPAPITAASIRTRAR